MKISTSARNNVNEWEKNKKIWQNITSTTIHAHQNKYIYTNPQYSISNLSNNMTSSESYSIVKQGGNKKAKNKTLASAYEKHVRDTKPIIPFATHFLFLLLFSLQ